jgi:hypothetical protein
MFAARNAFLTPRGGSIPTIYAATTAGLSISTDGGTSFTNRTVANSGLSAASLISVFVSGSNIYAGILGGQSSNALNISTNGGTSFTYVSATTLGNLNIQSVPGISVSGSTIYAATQYGLSISTNGGSSWSLKTTADGLGANYLTGVFASGSNVYAGCDVSTGSASSGGLAISTNGGTSFTAKFTGDGIGGLGVYNGIFVDGSNLWVPGSSNLTLSTNGGSTFTTKLALATRSIWASGSNVYAATNSTTGGLYTTTDGGSNWTQRLVATGLGSNNVFGVYGFGSTIYAATNGGLSISTDGGSTFTNKTTTAGLGSNTVRAVFVA